MKLSLVAAVSAIAALSCVAVRAYQRVADYDFGNDESPTNIKAEFYWSRLAFASNLQSLGSGFGSYGYWRRNAWSRDYPKADRQFLIAMHRLTRIDGRPTEQVVNPIQMISTTIRGSMQCRSRCGLSLIRKPGGCGNTS
jgi:hypothetical protein